MAVLQDNVANRVNDTIAGLRGEIRKKEEADASTKSAPSLEEYDYYLRGHQLFFRFTQEDNAKARAIWQEGLAQFPNSALLRTKIAFSYIHDISGAAPTIPGATRNWRGGSVRRRRPFHINRGWRPCFATG